MVKQLTTLALLFFSILSFGQIMKHSDSLLKVKATYPLSGIIVDFKDKAPLKAAHLFNLNSVIGTISNDEGKFIVPTVANDTLYISYLGYQSIKLKITHDLLKGNELVIELHERTEQMQEVVVKSHKLIGVLEIDVKNVPTDKYSRIHINGIPQTYEVGVKKAKTYNSAIYALFKPIDFVYNRFGKKPRELEKLKKLRDDDKLRAMLETNFNRELMMEYLDMNDTELNEFLNECNYSDYFIKEASDLQLIEAALLCYENYKAIRKGSTIREAAPIPKK